MRKQIQNLIFNLPTNKSARPASLPAVQLQLPRTHLVPKNLFSEAELETKKLLAEALHNYSQNELYHER